MKYLHSIIGFSALVLAMTSCNQDDGILGQELQAAGDGFAVTSPLVVTNYDPDFSADETVGLEATMNQEVSTTITLTGMSSGAVYEQSMVTSSISAENFTWGGGNTGIKWFQGGEQVVVSISFFGSTEELVDTITIENAINFGAEEDVFIVSNSSFENTLDWANGQWWVGASPGVSATLSRQEVPVVDPISGTNTIDCAVSGTSVFVAQGTKGSASTYMGGGSQGVRDGAFLPNISEDADEVWVNVYSYGLGEASAHTNLSVIFHEADGGNNQNQNGRDDQYIFQIPTDHEGWKLISKKYSALAASTYCSGTEGGGCATANKVHEPHKIDLVGLNFETETADQVAAGVIDLIIITVGGPFDPSKY